MVEENEIRLGLSQYERARVAALATARGVFADEEAALLRALRHRQSRPKRSRIRAFLEIYHAPRRRLALPRRTCPSGSASRSSSGCATGGGAAIAAALAAAAPPTPEAELALLAAPRPPAAAAARRARRPARSSPRASPSRPGSRAGP